MPENFLGTALVTESRIPGSKALVEESQGEGTRYADADATEHRTDRKNFSKEFQPIARGKWPVEIVNDQNL